MLVPLIDRGGKILSFDMSDSNQLLLVKGAPMNAIPRVLPYIDRVIPSQTYTEAVRRLKRIRS